MAFDLVKLLADILWWNELVVDMPALDPPRRQVAVIVLERFDCSRQYRVDDQERDW